MLNKNRKVMEKEFVPYKLAVKLKELGFDEVCLAFYDGTKAFTYSPNNNKIYAVKILAPLWQQAFDWFEKEHNLYSSQDNIVLDYNIADCRNSDLLIIKTIGVDSIFKDAKEVKENRLRHLIKTLENEKYSIHPGEC